LIQPGKNTLKAFRYLLVERFPFFGQCHFPTLADKQLAAQNLLKLADLLANRSLTDKQFFCCFAVAS
jgi:hypothetical protein